MAGAEERALHVFIGDALFLDLRGGEPDAVGKAETMIDGLLVEVVPKQSTRKRITEIAKERGWEPLPDHIVTAQLRRTIPSVRLVDDEEEGALPCCINLSSGR